MQIPKERIEEYQRAYKGDTGEEISFEEASEIVHRMLRLYEVLARPLPSEARRPQKDVQDE